MHQKLILVDGSSYLFRAYHAMPPLTNTLGEPTGAIYGVINMLKKLQLEYSDCHFCVVFDAKGKNFRHDLYPDYKANRGEMPEDLVPQVEPIFSLVRALGMPLVSVEGVEADDVIGTLADLANRQGFSVLISTGDKDMAQLVCENITLVNTMTDVLMDPEGVEARFGVKPNQMIDYLALVGDTSDNVPGVPKVGSKTAAKWLSQYHSLENLIEHKDEIKGKVGENLRDNLSQLHLSKELVTIKRDLNLEQSIADLTCRAPDQLVLKKYYEQFEFKAWLKELSPTNLKESKRAIILTEAELDNWISRLNASTIFAFDCETTSLSVIDAELVGLSFALSPEDSAYIPLAHVGADAPCQLEIPFVIERLKPLFESKDKTKIAHNLKYDMSVLKKYDLAITEPFFDTMLASYVSNSTASRHDMDTLADKHLGIKTITFEEVAGKGKNQVLFSEVPLSKAVPYACQDAEVCFALHETFESLLSKTASLQSVFNEIEMPLVPILSEMERWGVLLDVDLLKSQSEALGQATEKLQENIYTLAGESFNIESPKQLQAILYDKLGLPILAKTPKGQPSTAEAVLSDLAASYELPALILEYRSLTKLKTTYTDKLPLQINQQTGRVHTAFHQAVTATGRLSSSEPNLQNIPVRRDEGRAIRRAFVVPKGHKMLALDYSQIELRIMAHLSQDKTLLDAFLTGQDVHAMTASEVFDTSLSEVTALQRRHAKAINFGLIYGMSAFGLAKQLEVSRQEAQAYMDAYFEKYPGVKQYMEKAREKAQAQGFVETISGRRLYLPEIHAKQPMRQRAALRTAINAPMQGSAADIIKKAMITLFAWMKVEMPEAKMLLQVHDELIFEVPESKVAEFSKKAEQHMTQAEQLSVPLLVSVGVGNNWEEAH